MLAISYKQVLLGIFLGVFFFIAFLGYEANAMVIESSGLEIRDTDIIGTELDIRDIGNQYVKIQYIKNWKDTIGLDEITEHYERKGNIYKVYTGKTYHKDGDLWFEVEHATTTLAEFQKSTEEIGLLKYIIRPAIAQTYYTGAGDGYSQCNNAVWNTIHDATTCAGFDYTASNMTAVVQTGYWITRSWLPFNTAGLDDLPVASATLFVWPTTVIDDDTTYVNFVGTTTQADPTELVAGDFDTCGAVDSPVKITDNLALAGASTGAYQSFVLNNAGLWNIDTDGYTLLGMRIGLDIDDTAPTSHENRYTIYTSEQTGTANDPYLLIELGEEVGEEATTTSVQVPCEMVINNDLSSIVGCMNIYTDSTTTPSEVRQWILHIPFFIWFILLVPSLWLANRIIIELSIRMRH